MFTRPDTGNLPPVLLDHVVDNPQAIRDMARANGPYFMPARYLVGGQTAAEARAGTPIAIEHSPPHLVGPVWRGDWAFDGEPFVEGADELLHLPAFVEGAKQMCDSELVKPEQVFVNLTTPTSSQRNSHTDIPEFHGVDRTNAPGWLLQAMGTSRWFEDYRITIITAVTWFHQGEGGGFRYWPSGRDADAVRQTDVWNTGVVGDNDFMHHVVEQTGPADAEMIRGMSLNTTLGCGPDGTWRVVEDGNELATFGDPEVRLSLSWKAKVYASEAELNGDVDTITVDDVLARFADELEHEISTDLSDPELAMTLGSKFNGYRPL